MADINLREIHKLADFMRPRNWIISHRDLSIMFEQYQLEKYELDPELVAESIGSKYDRVTKFCTTWPNLVVSKFLLELLDYSKQEELSEKEIAELEECKQIARALRHKSEDGVEITLASPYFENIRESVLADLGKAKQVIWICMYLFTDYKIARKVVEKFEEGLSVELILQEDEKNRRQELQTQYWNKLPSILWWYPKTDGINHDKFCIIDGRRVWHGSFNFTNYAATKNKEHFTSDDNPEIVGQFADEFKKIKKYINDERRVRRQIEDY